MDRMILVANLLIIVDFAKEYIRNEDKSFRQWWFLNT